MLWVSLAGLFLIIIGAVYWSTRKPTIVPEERVPINRMQIGGRRQPRVAQNEEQKQVVRDTDGVEEGSEDEEINLDKKEQLKQQKKEERKAQREAMRAHWDEVNKKKAAKEDKYRQREIELEEKFAKEEEERKKLEEEKAKKEEEEYLKWKDMFAVEKSGDAQVDEGATLSQFVEYVKRRKVVMLEDLGSAFGIDGRAAAARLEELEKQGHICGLMDDRGKYIFITEKELEAVRAYIERRGRISRAELCAEANRLIRLEPTPEDKALIEDEDKKLMAGLETETKEAESK
mmetsp:Transcript_13531/g.25477  ORF Transcript_13531/g.25477 Transcript_13531/m.25477 type:complete len:289 (-) Transcript_13531:71-937(-)